MKILKLYFDKSIAIFASLASLLFSSLWSHVTLHKVPSESNVLLRNSVIFIIQFIHSCPHADIVLIRLLNYWQVFFFLEGSHFCTETEIFRLVEIFVFIFICFLKYLLESLMHQSSLCSCWQLLLCSPCLGHHLCIPTLHRLQVLVSQHHQLSSNFFGQWIKSLLDEELLVLEGLLEVPLGDAWDLWIDLVECIVHIRLLFFGPSVAQFAIVF